jgi:hypothetical protein
LDDVEVLIPIRFVSFLLVVAGREEGIEIRGGGEATAFPELPCSFPTSLPEPGGKGHALLPSQAPKLVSLPFVHHDLDSNRHTSSPYI